jgi:hypothetical protein
VAVGDEGAHAVPGGDGPGPQAQVQRLIRTP